VATGEPDTIDTDEVITAVAKTVAELTSSQDGAIRQNMIEQLMREIMNYDAEFRQQDAMGTDRSHARH
jgi:ribosomal protein S3AE